MSNAVAVCHGGFGRAAVYDLDKTIVTHAHREGHLIFHVGQAPASVIVGDTRYPLDAGRAVAVSPWEPHSFHVVPGLGSCLCLTLYIKPMWFLENGNDRQVALTFGQSGIEMTPGIATWVLRLTAT